MLPLLLLPATKARGVRGGRRSVAIPGRRRRRRCCCCWAAGATAAVHIARDCTGLRGPCQCGVPSVAAQVIVVAVVGGACGKDCCRYHHRRYVRDRRWCGVPSQPMSSSSGVCAAGCLLPRVSVARGVGDVHSVAACVVVVVVVVVQGTLGEVSVRDRERRV